MAGAEVVVGGGTDGGVDTAGAGARYQPRDFKHKSRIPVELMQQYGRERAREGFTDVVFGHFHEKLVLPGKATVTVLPAWYQHGEALRIDPKTGANEFVVI